MKPKIFSAKDVAWLKPTQREIGSGTYGRVFAAKIKFKGQKPKSVAAKLYHSRSEARELTGIDPNNPLIDSTMGGQVINTRFLHEVDRRVRPSKVGNPLHDYQVQMHRDVISKLRQAGCAVAKMGFVEHKGLYYLVFPLFAKKGKSIVWESDYPNASLAEKKLAWQDLGRMANAGFYTPEMHDTYFFVPTKTGKKPIIIDIDKLAPGFPPIENLLKHEKGKVELAKSFVSALNPKLRRVFAKAYPKLWGEIIGKKARKLLTTEELEYWDNIVASRERKRRRRSP